MEIKSEIERLELSIAADNDKLNSLKTKLKSRDYKWVTYDGEIGILRKGSDDDTFTNMVGRNLSIHYRNDNDRKKIKPLRRTNEFKVGDVILLKNGNQTTITKDCTDENYTLIIPIEFIETVTNKILNQS